MAELIPLEQAVQTVLDHVPCMPVRQVPLLDAAGRVAAADLHADADVAPFDHAAMDGYCMKAAMLACASDDEPVRLEVVAHIGAGEVYDGPIGAGQCVRIMTGAPLPSDADAVVKYEATDLASGDGSVGSTVLFYAPVKVGNNVRRAGEEARAGACVVQAGQVVKSAGVGFLASCGVAEVPTYEHPRVAIICTGSELVPYDEVPRPGKIRNSNGVALAACVQEAGGIPSILPIVPDTFEDLEQAILDAITEHDVVVTTGGAADGDYDFIKPVAEKLGEVYQTTVNIRPGKAQTFALVQDTPVFGLPGNPAAAYLGFQLLVRPGLRKMQGYTRFAHPSVTGILTADVKKRDPRRIYLRAVLEVRDGTYLITPADNQNSGLFGPIQRTNCLAIMPEGPEGKKQGDSIECLLVDVSEEIDL